MTTTDLQRPARPQAFADSNGDIPTALGPTTPSCPKWCRAAVPGQGTCDRDHHAEFGHVPATGSVLDTEWDSEHGFTFPSVGVTLYQCESSGDDGPRVSLEVAGPRGFKEAYLKPSEARDLVARLQSALTELEHQGSA